MGYPDDLNCGPNFHTDVTASDSLLVTDIVSAVTDGTVNIVLNPPTGGGAANNLGRLKIFSVNLQVEQFSSVPEPSVLALVVFALSGVAVFCRRKGKPGADLANTKESIYPESKPTFGVPAVSRSGA